MSELLGCPEHSHHNSSGLVWRYTGGYRYL